MMTAQVDGFAGWPSATHRRFHFLLKAVVETARSQTMRIALPALALLTSLTSTAYAGPKEDALAVLDQWTKAFSASDVDAIVKLYAPDALFIGTGSKTVVTRPEGIRRYFENALLTDRPRTATLQEHEVAVLSGTTVVVTGLDLVTGVRDGQPLSLPGRVTFIVSKRGPDWRIVHFHRSAVPN
jgi:uncharacterized protein (TIGR02246 family)